jgi:hypothetical protein
MEKIAGLNPECARHLGHAAAADAVLAVLVFPCRGLALRPIQSFVSSFEFVDMLDRAVRPFGFYLPMFAVFENYTKYRNSLHMMAQRQSLNTVGLSMQDTSKLRKTPSAAEACALGARDSTSAVGGQEAVSATTKALRTSQRYLH